MYADQSDQERQDELDRQALLAQMTPPEPPPAEPDLPRSTLPVPDVPPPTGEKTAGPDAPAAAPGPYKSNYGTVSGYLQDAMRAYAPTVQAAKSEQEAKGLAEAYIRSLVPEIQARGGNVGDIKNEKVMIDGKWVDLYRDIGGASEAQYLVDEGGGGPAPAGGMPALMDTAGTSDYLMGSSLPTDEGTYQELMRRLQEILGPEATDRQALLTQMKA
jgi:hypothetical protein